MENTKETKYVPTPTFVDRICLNNQTAGNLIKYLQKYPPNAKVVITTTDREGIYKDFDCIIGCNFEHQQETNVVQLSPGFVMR